MIVFLPGLVFVISFLDIIYCSIKWAARKCWATAPSTQSSTRESSVVHMVDYRPLQPTYRCTRLAGWTASMVLPRKEWMENMGYESPIPWAVSNAWRITMLLERNTPNFETRPKKKKKKKAERVDSRVKNSAALEGTKLNENRGFSWLVGTFIHKLNISLDKTCLKNDIYILWSLGGAYGVPFSPKGGNNTPNWTFWFNSGKFVGSETGLDGVWPGFYELGLCIWMSLWTVHLVGNLG